MLTSVPFGASTTDVAEFLLGSVAVNVVFMESNGEVDKDTEEWTDELRDQVKENIEEGLQWWVDTLAIHSDVHELSFEVDYTHADTPVETKYEPISRSSNDFRFWIEEFFREVEVPAASGFTTEIRNYNHIQRVEHDTNWSFTIFVVNAENDDNGLFGDADGRTTFKRAFAYPGGQFIVMPHHRPPSTVAHELAHIFWAHDEYSGGDHYTRQRGYYRTQNTNAVDGNPDPDSREPSLMSSTGTPFTNHELSQSARETLGWRDSDGDGIFDVLDVPHVMTGNVTFDETTQTARFIGDAVVGRLDNQNPSGSGRDMTINRITDLQYRIDGGTWLDLLEFDDYQISIDATTPTLGVDAQKIEFRTFDEHLGITSNVIEQSLVPTEAVDVWGTIDFDDYLTIHSTGEIELVGLEVVSDDAKLVFEDPSPFIFALAVSPTHVTLGNLGTTVSLDGTLRTGVRYEGSEPDSIEASYGNQQSSVFPIAFSDETEPLLSGRIGADGYLYLEGSADLLGIQVQSDEGRLEFDSHSVEFDDALVLDYSAHQITIGVLGEAAAITVEGQLRTPIRWLGNDASDIIAFWGQDSELRDLAIQDFVCGDDRTAADADGDGLAGFPDFLIVSANFGDTEAVYADGDFDCDGEVSFSDFLILGEVFGPLS